MGVVQTIKMKNGFFVFLICCPRKKAIFQQKQEKMRFTIKIGFFGKTGIHRNYLKIYREDELPI